MAQQQADGRTQERAQRKTRVGRVVSTAMEKTAVVAVQRRTAHPVYGKQIRNTKKFHAHDEENDAREGDTVRIMETRPMSKTKRWRVVEILERAR